MNAFRIRVADLEPGPNRVRLEAPAASVGLDPDVWGAPLVLELQVDRQGDQLTLRGRASTRIQEECARCLRRSDSAMEFEFSAFADRAPARGGSEAALDEYVLGHDGRSVELDEEVREQAILSLPMQSLCRPECAGLCPRCGADLNLGPCGCTAGAGPGGAPGRPSP
jgi:uncharacterized protein